MSPHSSAPAPESGEFFMPPVEGRLFDPKLAKRLQLSKTSSEPLISESAKALLSAERDLMEALMIIEDMRNSGRPAHTPQPKVAEAQVIQFPILPQLQPIEGLDMDVPAANTTEPGFQPVVYKNEGADLSEDDDSGLAIITADKEDDERIFEDFGFEASAEGELDEWDELYYRIKEVQLLDGIVRKTGSRDVQKLAEKLRVDPNSHLSEKDKGKKN